jgi:hypothetical protein
MSYTVLCMVLLLFVQVDGAVIVFGQEVVKLVVASGCLFVSALSNIPTDKFPPLTSEFLMTKKASPAIKENLIKFQYCRSCQFEGEQWESRILVAADGLQHCYKGVLVTMATGSDVLGRGLPLLSQQQPGLSHLRHHGLDGIPSAFQL